jgi:hypothetical protein
VPTSPFVVQASGWRSGDAEGTSPPALRMSVLSRLMAKDVSELVYWLKQMVQEAVEFGQDSSTDLVQMNGLALTWCSAR